MAKYRKKPVVIEAIQVVAHDQEYVATWCNGISRRNENKHAMGIDIQTLEGWMHANLGDWIIKGVKGEFYPCKPDIFSATYEEV